MISRSFGQLLHQKTHLSDLLVVLACGVYVYFLVFQFPFTPFLNEADQHIFLYEGMRLFQGDAMYRDFFQFTFPGSQAYYWAVFSVFGLRYWILSLTIIALACGSVWSCLQVSKKVIADRYYYFPAVLFIFFGFRWFGLDGSHRMFSPIFVLLAVLFLLRGRTTLNLVLAGVSCGAASFFTQQRGVLAVIAIVAFIVIDGFMQRQGIGRAVAAIATVAGSFVASLLILCSYFIAAAGSENFVESTIIYPAKYYGYSFHNNLGTLPYDINNTFKFGSSLHSVFVISVFFYLFFLPAVLLAFWLLFTMKCRRASWAEWRNITLIALVASVLTFTTFAPNSGRLYQVAAPSLIVLGWLLYYFKENARLALARKIPAITAAAVAVLVLFGAVQVSRLQSLDYSLLATPSGELAYLPQPVIEDRYGWLLERTRPGDTVFEAYQPFVYFPLHLRNPTAYGQIWDSDYTRPEHVATTIRQLEADPPRYILWDDLYNKPPESRQPGDHIGPLYQFMMKNYRPAGKPIDIVERVIQVWERKPSKEAR